MRPIQRNEILPIGDYEAIRPRFRARIACAPHLGWAGLANGRPSPPPPEKLIARSLMTRARSWWHESWFINGGINRGPAALSGQQTGAGISFS